MNCGEVIYKMSRNDAKDILANRGNMDKKADVQKYLCDYVNKTYGLLYRCVRVEYID